ncbi:MAG: response regulator [Desulfobulbaceae bacterium]|nr:response regulator [Desulfobulbaceae bacterium]
MIILIIDDTKLSRTMIIKRMPTEIRETSTIIQGSNGEEAVMLYKEHSPDIVFLDLTMPVMDGFGALPLIKEHDPQAIVYVVTADVQAKSKEKVLQLGATSMEAKPISEVRLAEIFASIKE